MSDRELIADAWKRMRGQVPSAWSADCFVSRAVEWLSKSCGSVDIAYVTTDAGEKYWSVEVPDEEGTLCSGDDDLPTALAHAVVSVVWPAEEVPA